MSAQVAVYLTDEILTIAKDISTTTWLIQLLDGH